MWVVGSLQPLYLQVVWLVVFPSLLFFWFRYDTLFYEYVSETMLWRERVEGLVLNDALLSALTQEQEEEEEEEEEREKPWATALLRGLQVVANIFSFALGFN